MIQISSCKKLALLVVGFCLCASGCEDDDDTRAAVLETTLTIQDSSGQESAAFVPGEGITFVLSVRNRTAQPRTITFPSGQLFNFIVLSENQGALLWKWSHGLIFTQAFWDLAFAPNETKTYTIVWDRLDNAGNPVGTGTYYTQGYLATVEENVNISGDFSPSQMRSEMSNFIAQ